MAIKRSRRITRGGDALAAAFRYAEGMIPHSSQTRACRGVAIARCVVAFAVSALEWMSPFVPMPASIAAIGATGYLAFSIVALWLVMRSPNGYPSAVVLGQIVDFSFFGALVMLFVPGQPPLVMYLLFPLAAAAVCLSPRGFIWASAAALSIYAIAGVIALTRDVPAPGILLRVLLLMVVCGLITHLRLSDQESRRQLEVLAVGRQETFDELPARETLSRVAATLRAPRVLLAWEENDEPWLHVAMVAGDEFKSVREKPAKYDPLIIPEVSGCPFVCDEASAAVGRLWVLDRGRVEERRMRAIHAAFVARFEIGRVMVVPVRGATFSGDLFVLDKVAGDADELHFALVVGDFVANRFDLYYLLEREGERAVAEERIRLSRDLHDGVLQSLTGASLQIEAIRRLIGLEPEAAVERLAEIQRILASDQRELRAFIRQLRPSPGRQSDMRLLTRLTDLRDRFRSQWGMEVEIDTAELNQVIFHGLRNEIFSLVNEAVANAARHAAASEVRVRISSTREAISFRISDNGRGFPFHGRYTMRELDEMKRGPFSLKERVASLGGEMTLDSTSTGSTIEMTIPVNWSEGSWLSAS